MATASSWIAGVWCGWWIDTDSATLPCPFVNSVGMITGTPTWCAVSHEYSIGSRTVYVAPIRWTPSLWAKRCVVWWMSQQLRYAVVVGRKQLYVCLIHSKCVGYTFQISRSNLVSSCVVTNELTDHLTAWIRPLEKQTEFNQEISNLV